MIKFRYTYGIPGKPESYFSKVFTLEEIELGLNDPVPPARHHIGFYGIIARDQFTGFKDKNNVDIFMNDKLNLGEKSEFKSTVRVIYSFATFKVSDNFVTAPLRDVMCPANPECEVIGITHQ